MKKLIILITLFFITTIGYSQIINRTSFSLKIDNELSTKQVIPITFDLDRDKITIYSQEVQLFDIESSEPVRYVRSFTVHKFYVNDTHYKKAYLELWLSDKMADVVRLIYNDVTYEYALYE